VQARHVHVANLVSFRFAFDFNHRGRYKFVIAISTLVAVAVVVLRTLLLSSMLEYKRHGKEEEGEGAHHADDVVDVDAPVH